MTIERMTNTRERRRQKRDHCGRKNKKYKGREVNKNEIMIMERIRNTKGEE